MGDEKSILYSTSDIYFSAFIMALDIPLEATEEGRGKDGSRKVNFIFKMSSADVKRMKVLYFGGTGTVRVRKMVDNIRNLKSLCHT